MGRAAAVLAGAAALLLTGAGPAQAHPLHYGDEATDWVTHVTGVSPAAALRAHTGDAGQRLVVSIGRATQVVIRGYDGEPFVLLKHTGAWVNARATTTYAVRGPTAQQPRDVDDTAPPRWQRVAATGSYVWHDTRTHWPGFALPPPVEAHPDQRQQVLTWTVPVVADGRAGAITGTLDWVPGSTDLAAAFVAAGCCVAGTALAWWRRWPAGLAAGTVLVVGADVAHSAGMVGARVGGTAAKLAALPGHGALSLALWAAALASAMLLRRRRELALYGLALTAALLCFVEGLPSLAALWHSQLVNDLPAWLDRLLVAVITGAGVGLSAAAVVRLVRQPANADPRRNA